MMTHMFWGMEWLQGRISAAAPGSGEETVPASFPKLYGQKVENKNKA